MTDLEFYSEEVFNKAVELGFNKEAWEEKNQPNKVKIKNEQ